LTGGAAALAQAVVAAQAGDDVAAAADRIMPFLADAGWLDALLRDGCRAMAADACALWPLRASRSGRTRQLLLARSERIAVTLAIVDPIAPGQSPEPITFASRRLLCRPLGGAAAPAMLHELADGMAVSRGATALSQGKVHILDESRFAWRFTPIGRPVVLLRAQIAPPGPVLIHRHDGATGARLSSVVADEEHDRAMMMLSLLRMQGRRDAADLFRAALNAPSGLQRWAAMREWLALDTAAALPDLAAMADGDAEAAVRDLARQTLAQAQPCPA